MASNLSSTVIEIMNEFAANTGLSSNAKPRRYLWTDAFAVCNLLGLQKRTQDGRFGSLALDLVNNVHNILGKHRHDDDRKGWISGLSDEEGKLHPTSSGLRIGKKLPERKPNEPYDDDMEWDRDGQYYHYITKWMYALNCMTRSTGDNGFNILAAEMVKGTHDKFTYSSGFGGKRMYWKMSIDLSQPQVRSMGHHDPLDGYITYLNIQHSLSPQDKETLSLDNQIDDLLSICKGKDWTTTDPLGMGGLLCDAYRIFMLMKDGACVPGIGDLLGNILEAAEKGLDAYIHNRYSNQLTKPADHRLAFREFGLSIGLQAIQKIQENLPENQNIVAQCKNLPKSLEKLQKYHGIVQEINNFWSNTANQKARSWKSHLDINMVMWATSLMPNGFLCL